MENVRKEPTGKSSFFKMKAMCRNFKFKRRYHLSMGSKYIKSSMLHNFDTLNEKSGAHTGY